MEEELSNLLDEITLVLVDEREFYEDIKGSMIALGRGVGTKQAWYSDIREDIQTYCGDAVRNRYSKLATYHLRLVADAAEPTAIQSLIYRILKHYSDTMTPEHWKHAIELEIISSACFVPATEKEDYTYTHTLTGEKIMVQVKPPVIETKVYVFGDEVKDLSEGQLIDCIRSVESELESLQKIKTKSKKLTKKIETLTENLVQLAEILDAK